MEVICNKQTLCDAITNVSKAVSAKSNILALEGIKVKLAYNLMELTGYDLELGIKTQIQVKSEDCGEFVINARLFNEIVKKMPSDEIYLDINDNMNVKIQGGSTLYNISALPADEFPDIPEIDKDQPIEVPQNILKNMINQTIYAVSVNDNKPILTGQLFDINNGNFNLVAIDGFRLAVRTENISCSENYNFVVPSKTMHEIARILKDESEKNCNIYTNNKHIVFDINNYLVFSRLLEGEFHKYQKSIPTNHTTEVVIKTKELIDSLERCSLLINDKNRSPVVCLFKNDELELKCSTGIGKIDETTNATIDGNELQIAFNHRYLADALKASESDQVRMLMNGSLGALKITPLQGESYTFLVLPVHYKE